MSENEMYKLSLKKVRKPFKTYDVSGYNTIYIEGNEFPISMTSAKLEKKAHKKVKCPEKHPNMINKLEGANVTFEKKEEDLFLQILPSVNYYRMSVFALYLGKDRSFTHLCNLYDFDRFLIESISKLIAPIEILIKTTLAYYLSTECDMLEGDDSNKGTLIYLDNSIYKEKHVRNNDVKRMLSEFSGFLSDKQDKDPSIKHHVEYYDGNIPIWVLVEHLTMGNIATFVTYLDRNKRKGWVRSFLEDTNDSWVIEWIKTVQFLRNTGAHFSRIYGKRFNYSPNLHPDDVLLLPEKYRDKDQGVDELDKLRHTFFGGLLILKRFYMVLPQMEQKRWIVFLDKMEARKAKFNVDGYYIGLPDGWKKALQL